MTNLKSIFLKSLYAKFLNEIELGMLDENIITQVAIHFWQEAEKEASAKGEKITDAIWDEKTLAATEELKLLAQLETAMC